MLLFFFFVKVHLQKHTFLQKLLTVGENHQQLAKYVFKSVQANAINFGLQSI